MGICLVYARPPLAHESDAQRMLGMTRCAGTREIAPAHRVGLGLSVVAHVGELHGWQGDDLP